MNAVSEKVRELIQIELAAANKKFPLFASHHEAIAVAYEEYQEAEEELAECKKNLEMCFQQIRVNNDVLTRTKLAGLRFAAEKLAIEAIQLAAMAQKALDSANNKRGE
jgi:hypothetical protein